MAIQMKEQKIRLNKLEIRAKYQNNKNVLNVYLEKMFE